MYNQEIKINIENGFHMRPASKFVKQAKLFKSEIFLDFNGTVVNAKSLFNLQSLNLNNGSVINIIAKGVDEKKAVECLINLISKLK